MTKVTIITTVQHNVGDDFVREGILHLLQKRFRTVRETLIHKHIPACVRPEFAWLHDMGLDRSIDKLRPDLTKNLTDRVDAVLPIFPWSDRLRNCDVLVQSGAPVYWTHSTGDCSDSEWWGPLIERRWLPTAGVRPFLNLAGGTCQHWGSDGSEFAGKAKLLDFIRRFYDVTALTTVRDELSVRVVALAGRTVTALPCTSIFAVNRLKIDPGVGEYTVLNYMPGGGHWAFGQPIDAKRWESTFRDFARTLATRGRCILACHDLKELKAAKSLLPGFEVFYSKDYTEYLKFYSKARWGIMNRVHGAFALASLGKPAVVVGTDSRAEMAGMIGLRAVFVNDASPQWLNDQAERLESETATFPQEMSRRKTEAEEKYLALLQAVKIG